MADDWAEDAVPHGITRRRSLQILGLVGGGAVLTSVLASMKSLLPPPIACRGEVTNRFLFGQPNPGQVVWWKDKGLVGSPARVTDFDLWQGAATTWRAVLDEQGAEEPGCGFPALVIRVDADSVPLLRPPAFDNFIIDETIDLGSGVQRYTFVALYDRCVHLCCFPGWHFLKVPDSFHDWDPRPRTYDIAGEDPVWCQCHNSQYDPATLKDDVHPNGVRYIGATKVHGPAPRALPAIPIRRTGLFIEGLYDPADGGHPEWYSAYCR